MRCVCRGRLVKQFLTSLGRWSKLKIKRSAFYYANRIKFILILLVSAYLTVFLNPGISSVSAMVPVAERSVQEQPTLPSLAQAPAFLVQQGKELYEAGQYESAVKVLQQASEGYKTQGDVLQQAIALSNLSLVYQQLGQWERAGEAISTSLQLISQRAKTPETLKVLAPALNVQGKLQLAKGLADKAVSTWEQAAATYAKVGDDTGKNQATINLAQALQTLGLYRRALGTLQSVNKNLQSAPDSLVKAASGRSLGNALRLVGDLEQSRQVLQQSLEQAKRLKSPQDIADALFMLGNTARAQQDTKAAVSYYQQAVKGATTPTTQIRALLNQLSLLVETQEKTAALALWPQIQSKLSQLPPSRVGVEARINLAESLMKLKQLGVEEIEPPAIAQMLGKAVREAKSINDPRAESFALGQLGALYEQNQQSSEANKLTQEALLLSQSVNASDISYRWEWQRGRLLKAQGETKGAIAAYTEAVNILKSLRSDLVAINSDVQFSFRESVEPIYRQLVGLLLQPGGTTEPSQEQLQSARNVIESLQLAELDNFFQEACLQAKPVQVDKVDPSAAVIYPIILEDRLEVILSVPGQPLRHYATPLSRSQVEGTLKQLKQSLSPLSSTTTRLRLSEQVYDWLIRPAAADLASNSIKTLVFVLDGPLRGFPMAALYDGKQYLLEQYSIALSPGLQLLETRSLARGKLQVFKGGLSEARQGFSALPGVKVELNKIESTVPAGKVLLNQQMTSENLQTQLDSGSYRIIHLATHGQFSSNAKETFILTWDGRINVKELDRLFRARGTSESNPLELLVLSACQTASGDNRASLGLAGVAVRSGARSTLATLWSVKDDATAILMDRFYKELVQPGVTKAEALRRAQESLLRDSRFAHPLYWAPFVLVGNWL